MGRNASSPPQPGRSSKGNTVVFQTWMIDGNNAWQIKAIGVVISTFETLPSSQCSQSDSLLDLPGLDRQERLGPLAGEVAVKSVDAEGQHAIVPHEHGEFGQPLHPELL